MSTPEDRLSEVMKQMANESPEMAQVMSTPEDRLSEVMKQMANESPEMAQAMQTPPPNSTTVPINPQLEDKGLRLFASHMSENAYTTFLSILHWSILCQNLSEGKQLEWSNELYAAMQAPFVGFGNPFLWEQTYSGNLGKIVHAHYFTWHSKGAGYRKANPLPHRMIREVAPLLANMSRGWQHSQMLQDLIEDPRTYEGLD